MGYHRPADLGTALEILSGQAPRLIAGGTDLFPAIEGPLQGEILDLTAIPELQGIRHTERGWRFGAAVKWAEIAAADLPPCFAALQQAARRIGGIQIQNSATLAGNLCNASPAADGVPPLQVLDAAIETASRSGTRMLPLAEFITGPRKTALKDGEMVIAVHVADRSAAGASAFEKLGARAHLVISIAMAAARVVLDGGRIARAAVSIGACSPVARRMPDFEAALAGAPASDLERLRPVLAQEAAGRLSPLDDVRASAGYRTEMAVEITLRALRRAIGEAGETGDTGNAEGDCHGE